MGMPPNAAAVHESAVHGLPSRVSEEERAKTLDRREVELRALAGELEARREQLAVASRCQAEFLANLSHELRTPLNSVLILSKLLVDNVEANLTDKQQSFARTIHSSGCDLLGLINDVIELSRIEAGALALEPEEISLEDLCGQVSLGFKHLAAERGITFSLELAPGLPRTLVTDGRRLHQVLKNLLLNAFKFTERGRVTLSVEPAAASDIRDRAEPSVLFSVIDTGIGVPDAQRDAIFQPFQQAGAKPIRGQRGAGLGLSLVRELSKLLGGEAHLAHSSASGSTFTVRIPARGTLAARGASLARVSRAPEASSAAVVAASGSAIVLVSADAELARALEPVTARAGLDLLRRVRADEVVASATLRGVVLDLRAPGLEGWIALDRMVRDSRSRHVPIFALVNQRDRARAARLGAFVVDAVTHGELEWIVQEAGWREPMQPRKLLGLATTSRLRAVALGTDLETRRVATAAELLHALATERFHALLVEAGAPGVDLREILEGLPATARRMPIVVHSERALAEHEIELLALHDAQHMVALADSDDLVALELSIALHRAHGSFSAAERERLERAARAWFSVHGLEVLIIDDDVRNIFAMTSALERHGVRVLYAESGRQGLDLLAQSPGIDAVLVDIRMSDQNGYEVVRAIRDNPSRASLPLIAVTANAMPADREECLASGATHYLAKPTTAALLVSTLRVATTRRG